MINAHEVQARDDERRQLAEAMAAWEAKHGPVVTEPPTKYDRNGLRITEQRNGWENRYASRMAKHDKP